MKQTYPSLTNYDRERLTIDRCETLDRRLELIPLDHTYSIDPIGTSLIRVFIHTEDSEDFTDTQIVKLRQHLKSSFSFKTTKPPKGTSSYNEANYRWKREFRESDGNFYMKRSLKHYWNDNTELLLIIEDSPKQNCKIIQKEKTITYYEADCPKEKA